MYFSDEKSTTDEKGNMINKFVFIFKYIYFYKRLGSGLKTEKFLFIFSSNQNFLTVSWHFFLKYRTTTKRKHALIVENK